MSGNRIVQQALTNRWLHEQGVSESGPILYFVTAPQ
jgi:hypothetical protein